jgi:hypothetical protein
VDEKIITQTIRVFIGIWMNIYEEIGNMQHVHDIVADN